MNKIFTFIAVVAIYANTSAQTQLPNIGFETWTGSGASIEPANYHSNKSGTGWASSGPQTCFQYSTSVHSGTYCAQIVTESFISQAVNGVLTSGMVNAPSTNKADGFIGTINGTTATPVNHIAFTGRPDSLVGWYKYTQSTSTGGTGGANESCKVRAILHKGNYYDPETPSNSNHPDSSANKIGDALFISAAANVNTWTRFSVPFNYTSASLPQYVMLNCTSSSNQVTTVAGSTLYLDDVSVVYRSGVGIQTPEAVSQNIKVFVYDKMMYVDFLNRMEDQSTITVYDLTGKVVSDNKLSNNKLNTINLNQLSSGLYLYQLTGTGFQKSGKLLIK